MVKKKITFNNVPDSAYCRLTLGRLSSHKKGPAINIYHKIFKNIKTDPSSFYLEHTRANVKSISFYIRATTIICDQGTRAV